MFQSPLHTLSHTASGGGIDSAWSGQEAADFDRYLQEHCGLPAALLMENAGQALSQVIRQTARQIGARNILFVAGPGNNGGDALVAARQLWGVSEWNTEIAVPLGAPARAGSPALLARQACEAMGMALREGPVHEFLAAKPELLVDGLFGIGLRRPLQGVAADWVQATEESGVPVLAVDVPSGLDSDEGLVLGKAMRARWTLSFVASKKSFYRGQGPEHVGELAIAEIGVSTAFAFSWLQRRRQGETSTPQP